MHFRPTYKFDFDSDTYDSSAKARIPAWCDRILFVQKGMECLAYNSDMTLKTSDHRPVYATFLAEVDVGILDDNDADNDPEFTSDSQVCTIS